MTCFQNCHKIEEQEKPGRVGLKRFGKFGRTRCIMRLVVLGAQRRDARSVEAGNGCITSRSSSIRTKKRNEDSLTIALIKPGKLVFDIDC